MQTEAWILFATLALAAVASPGPAMLAILAHALARGGWRTIPVVLGNGLGVMLMMAASVLGLATLIASIPYGLEALKWIGAAYLAWLGTQAWRARPLDGSPPALNGRLNTARGLAKGLGIALSNPKAILFFGAILPQFVVPGRPLLTQLAVLSGTFVALELTITGAVAFAAHGLTPLLRRPGAPRLANRISGTIMIVAAVALVGAPEAPKLAHEGAFP